MNPLDSLIQVDQAVSNLIFRLPSNTFTVTIMRFFSVEGIFIFGWLVLLAILNMKRMNIYRKSSIFLEILTVLLIANVLINVAIKPFFGRLRPHITAKQLVRHETFIGRLFSVPKPTNTRPPSTTSYPTDYSFPSGHATLAFALATVLSMRDRKLRWAYLLVASLVAFSRIYLGYHYLLDVFVGGMIGWVTAKIFMSIKLGKIS